MIDSVTIKNFAIINEMSIDFHPGLTVITGETGSGKSIILQAINTLVQGKSRKSMLKSGAAQAVVDLDFNKNFYMGTPVLSTYEKPLIDKLAVRPSTRKLAVSISNWLSNTRGINIDLTKKNQQFEGSEQKEAPFNLNPIKIDYIIRAYATGLFGYVPEVINAAFFETGGPFTETFGNEKGLRIEKPTPDVNNLASTPNKPTPETVSYTHLTLPTIYSV